MQVPSFNLVVALSCYEQSNPGLFAHHPSALRLSHSCEFLPDEKFEGVQRTS